MDLIDGPPIGKYGCSQMSRLFSLSASIRVVSGLIRMSEIR